MATAASRLILGQAALGDPALSADAALVAYSRRTVVANEYRTHVWVVPARGGRPRQLTNGRTDDAAPAFTPAADAVLFLRDRRVWRIPLGGGEAEVLARLPYGVDAFALSPDGRRLLLTGPSPEPRFAVGRLEDDAPPRARVIRRLDWRLDGTGILDRRSHLWVAAARPGARPRRVLAGEWSAGDAVWSPDGRRVAFSCDPDPDADLAERTRIFTLEVEGGEPAEVGGLRGGCRDPAWSPDGAWIAFRGIDEEEALAARESIWVVPAGGGTPRDLAPALHLLAGAGDASDLYDWRREGGDALAWDDGAVLATCTERGHAALWRFPLEGAPAQVPATAGLLAVAFAAGRAALLAPFGRGADLALADAGRRRRLTRHGAGSPARLRLRDAQHDIDGPAGPIRLWTLAPEAADGPLPAILSIIGGPGGTWGPAPWLPDMALAAAGYLVLRPDPRGSGSYGRAYADAIRGAWGGADAEDQLAVCDWAVAEGLADPARLGVWGLSYGGFMTSWLVTQTDRFGAAVSVNGVSNQVAAAASCDVGPLWTPRLGWRRPPAGEPELWAQSPLAHAERVRTPLLLLQGEDDLRCPASDNEQLFAALRALGREVEYVLYPEEWHTMQAVGRPDRRVDMLERTLGWFERHLEAS